MKKTVCVVLLFALMVCFSSSVEAAVLADWWSMAGTDGAFIETDWGIHPGSNLEQFNVISLGLKNTGDVLHFAMHTKWDIKTDVGYYGKYHNGDFMFDFNNTGSFDDLAIDFTVNDPGVDFRSFYGSDVYFENGKDFHVYDPIGVYYNHPISGDYAGPDSIVDHSWNLTNAFEKIDGEYFIQGSVTAAQAGVSSFYGLGDISMRWAMSCGNDAVTVTAPVPEPATMAMLGLSALGMAAFRRKK
jgi:hypothetical protein